jgi:hypothetical protein
MRSFKNPWLRAFRKRIVERATSLNALEINKNCQFQINGAQSLLTETVVAGSIGSGVSGRA